MGINKKEPRGSFLFIPIEQPFEQWSRAAQAKFVPTRVAISAGNKRLVNGSCPEGQTTKPQAINNLQPLQHFIMLERLLFTYTLQTSLEGFLI